MDEEERNDEQTMSMSERGKHRGKEGAKTQPT